MSDKNTPMAPPRRRGPRPGGGPMAMMPGEKAKDFKGALRKLVRHLGEFKGRIILVMIFALASTIFTIVGPKILGNATTALFEGVMNILADNGLGIDFTYIAQILLLTLGLYLISAFFQLIQGLIMSRVSNTVTYGLRRDILSKINRLPIKYFDTHNTGEVLSHVTNDVDVVSQNLSNSITQIITSVASLIGYLVMMFSISWQMTLIAVVVLPVPMIFVSFIVKKSQKYFSGQQTYLGNVNGHIEEMYGNHTLVKVFNGEKRSVEIFEESNDKLYNSAWKSQFLSGLMMPILNVISNIGYVIVCILGGYYAASRAITVGDIQAFIQYMRSFTQPITQVANISNVLQQTMAAAERIFAFLEEEEEQADPEPALPIDSIEGSVMFAHVNFGYLPGKTIINDFSAIIEQGKKIAIVGPTGAGKTTIVKLLMRYYDVDNGAILVDGYSLKQFRRNDLRSLFGMVLQDTWLYSGTIRENIRYGKLDATDEEVRAAAKSAQVDHFVRTLPEGYDTVLNEESTNISQGQKQLLTIARAILSDPKILILDEATSSVDTRTEIMIQKAMDNLMKGRTSFVIAHRLSTIRDADMILVMDHGDVVETGTHQELLAKGGFYASLYNSQFETSA